MSLYCIIPVNGHRDGFAQLLRLKSLVSLSLGIESLSSHKEHNTSLQYMKRDLEREFVPCKLLECPTQISPTLRNLDLTIPETSDSDVMKCLVISLGNSNVTNLNLYVENYLVSCADMFPSLLSMKAIETLSLHLCKFHPSSPILPTASGTVSSLVQTQPFVVLTKLEGLRSMLETSETLTNLELFIEGLMTEADVQHLADGLSVDKSLTTLVLSSISTEFSPTYKALQHKANLEVLHICDYDSKHTAESGHIDLQEALKSNVCLRNLSLIGVGDNEVKYIADGLKNHPSLDNVRLGICELQISCLRALHSCPALCSIHIHSLLAACQLWVQDDTTVGHLDTRHDTGSELEAGDWIGASLLQEQELIFDFFPFLVAPPCLPNTRLIVEGVCKNLVAHYPFLKNCGFATLRFHGQYVFALSELEPVQCGETGGLDSSLLPTEWESVDRVASFETIRVYQETKRLEKVGDSGGELQQCTAHIGVRIQMESKRMDLLLKVVEGVCWMQHHEPPLPPKLESTQRQ